MSTDEIASNVYRNAAVGATRNPLIPDPDEVDEDFASAANRALEDAAELVRVLTASHQSAIAIVVERDWGSVRKYFSLSPKYAAWADYRTPATGYGIHAWMLDQDGPVRLTQAELEAHPAWQGFGTEAGAHPPMRGWLAAPLRDRTGKHWGLVQASDKVDGSDYGPADEQAFVRLVDLVSLTLESLWEIRNARKERRTPTR